MYTAVAISLVLAVAVQAQTTVVSLMLLDTDPQPLVASVIAVESSTTTYSIACPTGTDPSDCGYGTGDPHVTQAPNFAGGDMTVSGQFALNWRCDITSSTVAAVCTASASGPAANFPGVETTTLSGTDLQYFPVTVTAGLDKLTTNDGAPDTTVNPTPTSGGSTGASQTLSNGSQSTPGNSLNSGSTGAATSSNGSPPSPTVSNNAGSKVTSNFISLTVISTLLGILFRII